MTERRRLNSNVQVWSHTERLGNLPASEEFLHLISHNLCLLELCSDEFSKVSQLRRSLQLNNRLSAHRPLRTTVVSQNPSMAKHESASNISLKSSLIDAESDDDMPLSVLRDELRAPKLKCLASPCEVGRVFGMFFDDEKKEIFFHFKWSNCDSVDTIPARVANRAFPQLVIEYYESVI